MSPTTANAPPRVRTVLPGFLGPMLLIVAAVLAVGVVYRATLSIPVTLIAATLAAVVGVAAPAPHRVYWYPTHHRNHPAE